MNYRNAVRPPLRSYLTAGGELTYMFPLLRQRALNNSKTSCVSSGSQKPYRSITSHCGSPMNSRYTWRPSSICLFITNQPFIKSYKALSERKMLPCLVISTSNFTMTAPTRGSPSLMQWSQTSCPPTIMTCLGASDNICAFKGIYNGCYN